MTRITDFYEMVNSDPPLDKLEHWKEYNQILMSTNDILPSFGLAETYPAVNF